LTPNEITGEVQGYPLLQPAEKRKEDTQKTGRRLAPDGKRGRQFRKITGEPTALKETGERLLDKKRGVHVDHSGRQVGLYQESDHPK